MWCFYFITFIIVCRIVVSKLQLFEGAICTAANGFSGVCKKISDCPAAVDDLINREEPFPSICYFENKDPVVCCSNSRTKRSAKQVCDGNFNGVQRRSSYAKRYASIIGGYKVISREFPHMAAIGFAKRGKKYWRCGGSVISKRYILTAAHCLEDRSILRFGPARFVRLGDLDLKSSVDDELVQQYNVAQRIPHPNYNYPSKYNDIGLLQLVRDIQFNDYIQPACLHSSQEIVEKEPVVTGWGRTENDTYMLDQKLMQVEIEFYPMEKCDRIINKVDSNILTNRLASGLQEESMICAGVLEGGRDSCSGDSGGPLQVRSSAPNCKFDIVGIVSFGIMGCAEKETPAIYVRVSNYISWIESIVC